MDARIRKALQIVKDASVDGVRRAGERKREGLTGGKSRESGKLLPPTQAAGSSYRLRPVTDKLVNPGAGNRRFYNRNTPGVEKADNLLMLIQPKPRVNG